MTDHRPTTTALAGCAVGVLAVVLLLPAAPSAAQTIRCWVNANGTRECSDQPPPVSAKDVKDVRGRAGAISAPESFSQRQASERFPVTLWVNACGEVCTSARQLLVSRGVPFTERNPDRPELQAEFKKVSQRGQVPMLIVGPSQLVGFEENQWNATLDAAGYSRTPVGPVRKPGPGAPGAGAPPGKTVEPLNQAEITGGPGASTGGAPPPVIPGAAGPGPGGPGAR